MHLPAMQTWLLRMTQTSPVVQGVPSALMVPTQMPPLQISSVGQGFPSSHSAPSSDTAQTSRRCWTRPVGDSGAGPTQAPAPNRAAAMTAARTVAVVLVGMNAGGGMMRRRALEHLKIELLGQQTR